MQLHSRLTSAALGAAAAIALAGCATSGGTAPVTTAQGQPNVPSGRGWIWKDGVLFHTPHYALNRRMAQHKMRPAVTFSYQGGPVLVTPKAYLIFWGYRQYGDRHGVRKLLENYFGNMGGSSYNNIVTAYYETSGSSTIYVTNPASQYGGAWMDNNPVPLYPTDAQIAQEAIDSVAVFGYDPNGSYVVATPHGRSSANFPQFFCAYHGATAYNGNNLYYTYLPYQPDAGRTCGAYTVPPPADEKGIDEGVTILEGHELGESVTDPLPGTGWIDGNGNEIGDDCEWLNVANDPFGSYSFTMQPLFSIATGTCIQSY